MTQDQQEKERLLIGRALAIESQMEEEILKKQSYEDRLLLENSEREETTKKM